MVKEKHDENILNTTKYNAEKSTLQGLRNDFNKIADSMNKSLADYKTEIYVATNMIPKDLKNIDFVLKRFYEVKIQQQILGSYIPNAYKYSNIIELVDYHPESVEPAIRFVESAIDHKLSLESRGPYIKALKDLELIQKNLGNYIRHKIEGIFIFSSVGGFDNIIKRIDLITKLEFAYENILKFAKFDVLSPHALPKTLEELPSAVSKYLKEKKFKQHSDLRLLEEKQASKTMVTSDALVSNYDQEDLKDFTKGGKVEIGGKEFLSQMRKIFVIELIKKVNILKLDCYQTPVSKIIKYNDCTIKSSENADIECYGALEAYKISRDNCDSHYKMITFSDNIMKKIFSDLVDLKLTYSEKEGYIQYYENQKKAMQDLDALVKFFSEKPGNDHDSHQMEFYSGPEKFFTAKEGSGSIELLGNNTEDKIKNDTVSVVVDPEG